MKTLQRLLPILFLGLGLLLAGCATTTVRTHPDFANAKRSVRTVALLPADTEMLNLVFTGENERDRNAEHAISELLRSSARSALAASGYQVSNVLLEKLEGGDREIAFEVEQLRQAYDRASADLYKSGAVSESEAASFRASVGPSVNALASAAGTDALLFLRYRGYSKSSGLVAKDVATGVLLAVLTGMVMVPVKEGHGVEVALIDGATGNLLWTNRGGGQSTNPSASLGLAMKPIPVTAALVEVKEKANTTPKPDEAARNARPAAELASAPPRTDPAPDAAAK